jgi:hypothetical protein
VSVGGSPPGRVRGGERKTMEKLITTIPKNSIEEVRVGLSEYNKHDLFYARIYFKSDEGAWLPSKKGLALKVEYLPKILKALGEAEREARTAGILTDD